MDMGMRRSLRTDVKTVRVDKGQNNYRPGVQGGQSIMRAVKKKLNTHGMHTLRKR